MDKLGKVFMLDDDFILLDMYRSLLESMALTFYDR